MPKITKRRKAMLEQLPAKASLELGEAVDVLKNFDTTKFPQSVEVALRLGIDAKQADQIVRGSIVLPHGIGKTQRVVVFAKGEKAEEALAAGADEVGEEDLAKKIQGGWIDFDTCIAAPDMMKVVGPLGRVLGPRGLMPSPRAGTVTPDVGKTVKEYKALIKQSRGYYKGLLVLLLKTIILDSEKHIMILEFIDEKLREA